MKNFQHKLLSSLVLLAQGAVATDVGHGSNLFAMHDHGVVATDEDIDRVLRIPMGTVSLTDRRPFVFVERCDGQIWGSSHTGKAWEWKNADSPPNGTSVVRSMGSSLFFYNPTGWSSPLLYFVGSDDAMWWYNPFLTSSGRIDETPTLDARSYGYFQSLGTPPNVAIGKSMGTIQYPTSNEYFVFVEGSDHQLWGLNWWAGEGKKWKSMGLIPGGDDGEGDNLYMGALLLDGDPTVFVKAKDGNLWKMSRTLKTKWSNLGSPISTAIDISIGAVEYKNEWFVFVEGSDDSLWVYSGGADSSEWTDLGSPAQQVEGVKLGRSMGGPITSPHDDSIYVFVNAIDGDLWLNTWNPNSGSTWRNLEVPTLVNKTLKDCKCGCGKGKKGRKCRRKCRRKRSQCKSDNAKMLAEKLDTIDSSMGVVLDADGVPSCFVKATDGNLWVNSGPANAREWSIAQASHDSSRAFSIAVE
jgi:hypothetical protein